MLDAGSLPRVLGELKAEGRTTRVDQYAFRSIALRHFRPPARPEPLHAATAGPLGTRFVPPSRPTRTLYVAFEVETAHREGNQAYYQTSKALGSDPTRLPPPDEVVLLGLFVRLARMLDVRDPEVLGRLAATPEELTAPWKLVADAPTQRLGTAVEADGDFESIVYQSAQHPDGSCLAIFPDRIAAGSVVEYRSRTPGIPSASLS